MSDTKTFEKQLGELSYNMLTEKVPVLRDHYMGFQIIDSDDDGERAVGVLGFAVNGRVLYIPSIFNKGKVEGMDLMFVRDLNLFMPARDNIVLSLKKDKNLGLGEAVTRKANDAFSGIEDVDLDEQDQTLLKTASANSMVDYKSLVAMHLNPAASGLLKEAGDLDTEALIKSCLSHKAAMEKFASLCKEDPGFRYCIEQRAFSPDFYADMTKVASAFGPSTGSDENEEEIVIIETTESKGFDQLSDKEKANFMEDGLFIKDNRKDTTEIFNTTNTLETISENGRYSLLKHNGDVAEVDLLVANEPRHALRTMGSLRQSELMYLITEDGKTFNEVRSEDRPLGKCIEDFRVVGDRIQKGGTECTRSSLMAKFQKPGKECHVKYNCDKVLLYKNGEIIVCYPYDILGSDRSVFTETDGKLHYQKDVIVIPKGTKAYPVKFNSEVSFGTDATFSAMLMENKPMCVVRVETTKDNAALTIDGAMETPKSKKDTFKSLVTNFGIQAGQAKNIMKEASSKGSVTFLMDKEASNMLSDSKPVKPKIERDKETHKTKPGRNNMKPREFVDAAKDASEKGVREIFDVSMMKPLIDAVDPADMKEEYLVQIVKGMDAVGRLLFITCWKDDVWEAKFGDQKTRELKNTLKDQFISLGDLVVFLRDKTVGNEVVTDNLLDTLSEDVNVI